MKKVAALLSLVLLASVAQAFAAGLISKSQAEQDALVAVGGGTVENAHKEKEMGKLIWSVDISGSTASYEVWVDAHTGAILQILTQPLGPQGHQKPISKAQAEQIALKAVGGGTVLSAHRDQYQGYRVWDIDILQPKAEYTVYVDAFTGAVRGITQQPPHAPAKQYISKAQAEQIALNAVGGGKVLLARLEKNDNPPVWSIDVRATNGKEYEVKVDAYTGKVLAIIPG